MPVDYFVTEVGGSSYVITLSVLISAGLLTLFTHLQGDLQAGGGGRGGGGASVWGSGTENADRVSEAPLGNPSIGWMASSCSPLNG